MLVSRRPWKLSWLEVAAWAVLPPKLMNVASDNTIIKTPSRFNARAHEVEPTRRLNDLVAELVKTSNKLNARAHEVELVRSLCL